jgi:23S rRNA (cytidine2498-2'-O)-methyltransferase
MVEQPSRVSELMARWIARRIAARAIFNLKLPMKKRWDELRRCRAILVEGPAAAGAELELRVKHLYHDREEVTAYLARLDARSRPGGGQGGGPYHSGGR